MNTTNYWRFVQNKRAAIRLIKEYIEDTVEPQKRKLVTVDMIKERLFNELEKKIGEDGICEGELEVSYCYPIEADITYPDHPHLNQAIVTIPQIALVGWAKTDLGGNQLKKHTLRQIWIGRVFPQWKGYSTLEDPVVV